MPSNHDLLKNIPKVDELLSQPALAAGGDIAQSERLFAVREVLSRLREGILKGEVAEVPSHERLALQALALVQSRAEPSVKAVINASGVVLHTNLGRALLPACAAEAAASAALRYTNLEYDVQRGERGSRHSHVLSLLCELTGAEDAAVFNNNAAAVLLMLSAISSGRETVISRGELVEIGGAFRVPDVMRQSGSILREVGTTNKTHLRDYKAAITPETGALLKVHASNFKIMGFTDEVPLSDLVSLGREFDLPVLHDLGSGYLLPLDIPCLSEEPTVLGSVKAGADVVCFSGDKLLGGPQAGIVIGRRKYIEAMKKHPLARAFRIDKMTLAALDATLRLYRDPDIALERIPTLRMLSTPKEALLCKANALLALIPKQKGFSASVLESLGQVGGGSAPNELIDSFALCLSIDAMPLNAFERRLRQLSPPVIARIYKDKLYFDVLTIDASDIPLVAGAITQLMEEAE